MPDHDLDNDFSMRCPKCAASDQIDIQALVWLRLSPDGTDPYEARNQAHEWGDVNIAQCCACEHIGTVKDFEIAEQPQHRDNEARAKRAAETKKAEAKPKQIKVNVGGSKTLESKQPKSESKTEGKAA